MMDQLFPNASSPDQSMHPLLQRLGAQARRCVTPCGQGELVWHVWGEAREGVPPLVLFHGGSGSWTHFVRNIESLVRSGRELWVPDLPGFRRFGGLAVGGRCGRSGGAAVPGPAQLAGRAGL